MGGYQYVEEGFRIRFANGETIDFYADSRALKDQWMEVLSQVIGKSLDDGGAKKARWTDLVLAKERKEAAFASTTTASAGGMAGGATESKDFEAPTSSSSAQGQQRPSTAHASLDSPNTDEAVPS